ncbi:4'-phosphopantetheinyl transferase family protein [Lentzea sp. CA-135723]|uniref:4'-phosphopantetheinyl transferase family protein n=1 Tax=Lentzea sp. CA-135723 TaxID=3239950 RepID=UPI003D9295A9
MTASTGLVPPGPASPNAAEPGLDLSVLTVPVGPGLPPAHVAVLPAHATATRFADATEHAAAEDMGPLRANEFLRGRSLLRQLVARVLGPRAAARPLRATGRGKPLLLPGVDVSISHTDHHTAAAVWTGGEIGVDVAEPPERLHRGLVRRCCGPHADDVLARSDAPHAFSRVWAVQEACVKATGMGLADLPWRIPVHPDARQGRWRRVQWHLVDAGPARTLDPPGALGPARALDSPGAFGPAGALGHAPSRPDAPGPPRPHDLTCALALAVRPGPTAHPEEPR